MSNNQNNEVSKKQTRTALIVGIIIIVIIVGIAYMKKDDNPEKNNNQKETDIEITYSDEGELTEDEIEQEAERIFEEDYTTTENFLGMFSLRKSGKELLYSNTEGKMDFSLIIYDSLEDRDAKFKESNEKITVDGKEYKLYSTEINYDTYKAELLNYMSESIYEKYFTKYTKNIDGKLYITNEVEDYYSLESLENTGECKYILSYKTEGETKEADITIDSSKRTISDINI